MRLWVLLGAACCVMVFQNCSKPVFKQEEVEAVAASSTDDLSLPVVDDVISNDIPVQNITPRLSLKIYPCNANSWCYVDYILTESFTQKVSFDWQTNDSKYLEDATKYARPNVHYLPAAGSLIFAPGETQKRIQIKALSGFSQILLPFLWRNCKVNDVATSCSAVLK